MCEKSKELWCLVPFTVLIIVIRSFFERCCFRPLAKWLKLKENKRRAIIHNSVLENALIASKQSNDVSLYHFLMFNLSSLAKKVDMSERQVERWWRLRRSQDKPSTLVKFCENMWMGSFYLFNFVFGLYATWDEQWFWDLDMIGQETDERAPNDIWWYYMISSAFYWSLTITQFWDVRRKDFWQMFVHHIATIALLTLSWLVNGYRAGCIILLLHDAADILLQYGKAAKLASCGARVTSLTYNIFVVTWLVTRLVLYPYCVLAKTWPTTYNSNKLSYCVLTVMMWIILLLNMIWSRDVVRVACKAFTTGEEPGDTRSSSSESENDEVKDT